LVGAAAGAKTERGENGEGHLFRVWERRSPVFISAAPVRDVASAAVAVTKDTQSSGNNGLLDLGAPRVW
jgi:hypothetical protein